MGAGRHFSYEHLPNMLDIRVRLHQPAEHAVAGVDEVIGPVDDQEIRRLRPVLSRNGAAPRAQHNEMASGLRGRHAAGLPQALIGLAHAADGHAREQQ
jgi:hypothetical protein